jgi:hypothetical protein
MNRQIEREIIKELMAGGKLNVGFGWKHAYIGVMSLSFRKVQAKTIFHLMDKNIIKKESEWNNPDPSSIQGYWIISDQCWIEETRKRGIKRKEHKGHTLHPIGPFFGPPEEKNP